MIALAPEVLVTNFTEITVLCEVGMDSAYDSTRLDVLYDGTETVRASFSCDSDLSGVLWELVPDSLQKNLTHIESSTYITPTGCRNCEADFTETFGDPSWCTGMYDTPNTYDLTLHPILHAIYAAVFSSFW
jgi:hypothetical protein